MNDLGNNLYNTEAVIEWIKTDFVADVATTIEETINNHPFAGYGANWKLGKSPDSISLFGLPIDRVYANYRGSDKFSLHVLIHLDNSKLKTLLGKMGVPENCTLEEIEKGDYDFLAWRHEKFFIYLHQTYMIREDTTIPYERRYSLFGFSVSNGMRGEIGSNDPIE